MYSTLLLDITGNLATLTLNRPDKRNAISTAMLCDLQSALGAIEKSHARVGILTGNGKAFSAGMDLEMLAAIAQQSPTENQDDSRRMAKMFRRIWSFSRRCLRNSFRWKAARRATAGRFGGCREGWARAICYLAARCITMTGRGRMPTTTTSTTDC